MGKEKKRTPPNRKHLPNFINKQKRTASKIKHTPKTKYEKRPLNLPTQKTG
jgi:hypothetical protein